MLNANLAEFISSIIPVGFFNSSKCNYTGSVYKKGTTKQLLLFLIHPFSHLESHSLYIKNLLIEYLI